MSSCQPQPCNLWLCCECGFSGERSWDEPSRLLLCVPCGHVIHRGCYEYLRRNAKLVAASSSLSATAMVAPATVCCCTGCASPILRVVQLFVSSQGGVPLRHGATQTSATSVLPTLVGTQQQQLDRIHHLQRKCLMRSSDALHLQEETRKVSAACASLHQETVALQQRLRALDDVVRRMESELKQAAPPPTAATSPVTCAGVDTDVRVASAALASLSEPQLREYVRDLLLQVREIHREVSQLRAQVVSRKSRLQSLRRLRDELRVRRAQRCPTDVDRRPSRAEPEPVEVKVSAISAATSSIGASAPPSAQVQQQETSSRHSEVIDVDALSDSDSSDVVAADPWSGDVDVVELAAPPTQLSSRRRCATRPRAAEVNNTGGAAVVLLPCAVRQLPRYGLGTGRSLLDFQRHGATLWQPTLDQLPPHSSS